MGYREAGLPTDFDELVEAAWVADGGADGVRVLPDGCMDLIRMGGRVVVAGPDTSAFIAARGQQAVTGLRFRPGVLPRLLGVPAAELVGRRVPLDDFGAVRGHSTLTGITAELASRPERMETAPWSLEALRHVTSMLAAGASVGRVAHDTGLSSRTVHRHCRAVYGYGPAMVRRILRFRRAVSLLQSGRAPADVAADAGYADQPHLHREVRAFAGTTVSAFNDGQGRGAKRSTEVPSGSSTVA